MMWSYPSTHLKTFHPQGYGLLQQPETANLVQVLPVLLSLDVLLGNWRARCHNWRQFENHTNSTPLKFTSFWHLFTAGGFGGGGTGGHHAWHSRLWRGPSIVHFLLHNSGKTPPMGHREAAFRDTFTAGLLEIGLLEPPLSTSLGPSLGTLISMARICLISFAFIFGRHFSQGFLFCWGGLFRDFFSDFLCFFLLGTSKKNAYRFH